jgi:hypothetical protein
VLQHAFRFRNEYVHGRRLAADFPPDIGQWGQQVVESADDAVRKLVFEEWPRPEP